MRVLRMKSFLKNGNQPKTVIRVSKKDLMFGSILLKRNLLIKKKKNPNLYFVKRKKVKVIKIVEYFLNIIHQQIK